MKRFIVKLLIFFLIVCVLDVCFGYSMSYFNSHSKGGEVKETYDLCMLDKYDAIIMGSSQARHHFVPKIISDSLHLKTYNAGYDGNGIILASGLYEMISRRYTPKLIIYNVSYGFDIYRNDEDDNNLRYLKYLKNYYFEPGIRDIFYDVSKAELYKMLSGFYRYNTDFMQISKNYLFQEKSIELNGYKPLYGEIKTISKKQNKFHEIDSLKVSYLKSFIHKVKKNKTELYFVVSPRFDDPDSNVLAPIKNICKDEGVKLLNHFNDTDFVNKRSLFKDRTHLNDKGAGLFTKKVIEEIKPILEYQL